MREDSGLVNNFKGFVVGSKVDYLVVLAVLLRMLLLALLLEEDIEFIHKIIF